MRSSKFSLFPSLRICSFRAKPGNTKTLSVFAFFPQNLLDVTGNSRYMAIIGF